VSYDIYALRVQPGEASSAALESILQRDDLVEGDPLDPAKEARKRSIAGTLATAKMGYEIIEHDYADVAEAEGISEDEARRQVRHLQVDNGELLVELDEEYAAVKIPYSSTLVECNIVEDVFKTLRVLREEGKFVPYDPQLGRELNIDLDREAFFKSFKEGVEQARKSGAEEAVDERPRSSLWKRLLGRG
jgi:hypothetical protein